VNPSEPLVYLNGHMLPASQARLPIYDAAVVLGATATEQTRTFRGEPFLLEKHIDRLLNSLRLARIDPGPSATEIERISLELVAHNFTLVKPGQELGLIQFVSAGEFAPFANETPVRPGPTFCIHTFPLRFERWAKPMREGAHVVTPSIRQVPPECYSPAMKYRSRMHFYLADKEARDTDPDAFALLLDLAGNITETSAANFLLVKDGVLISPTTRNILPGISRAMTRSLVERMGIGFAERDISVTDTLQADEALLTSTPFCLMPVTRINGTPIGSGKPGPMFQRLIQAWSDEVGLNVFAQIAGV
jgi:branched-subunit amino acid aminotransferase/4-amino-4-deoxychorismate lyase